MVRIAKKDTYAMDPVGGGVEVRRVVRAGQPIPDQYVVEGGTEDVENQASPPGYTEHVISRPPAAEDVVTDPEADAGEDAEAKPPTRSRAGHRK